MFQLFFFRHFFYTHNTCIKVKLFTNKRSCETDMYNKKNVKIWIAILMKKKEGCKLIKPFWLKSKWFKKKYTAEKKFVILQKTPNAYMEISYLFFITSKKFSLISREIYHRLKKLYFLRFKKIWLGITGISEINLIIKLGKIELSELCQIKKLIKIIFDILEWLTV